MSFGQIVLGILLFALATAVLYVWGLKKSMTQEADLERILLNKCAGAVVKYLRKHGSIAQKEIPPLIQGVKAGMFWSKSRVRVQDPAAFAPKLVRYMLEQQLLEDAGGLRYHGMSPILSKLYHDGYMEAVAYEQTRVFEAAVLFAKRETILPAPESAHAIRGAIDEALRCRESREAKTILFGLTGTGYFDMTAYENYLSGKMSDSIPTDADLQKGFDSLPKIPQNEGI